MKRKTAFCLVIVRDREICKGIPNIYMDVWWIRCTKRKGASSNPNYSIYSMGCANGGQFSDKELSHFGICFWILI